MRRRRRSAVLWLAAAAMLALGGLIPAGASARWARQTSKKAIWGPAERDGRSLFPTYRALGVGIYETRLSWRAVAPVRPAHATDPRDPAYQWPASLGYAVSQARKYHIRVAIQIAETPGWANGGRALNWAPNRAQDFARFAQAAARRYPRVHLWMIWGEPSRSATFRPEVHETVRQKRRNLNLTRRQKQAPHRYARILDAAYGRLKSVSRHNLVIGGDTFTTGDITPFNWIRNLRLRNGRPPRMDLYGHNPFIADPYRGGPNLRRPPSRYGFADFSDLDTLAGWLDRYLRYPHGAHRHLKIFISEFFAPTNHPEHEFNYWVDRRTQAHWLTDGLRIARHYSRIYTFGWLALYDDPPFRAHYRGCHQSRGCRYEVDRGLITYGGQRKRSYYAYKRG